MPIAISLQVNVLQKYSRFKVSNEPQRILLIYNVFSCNNVTTVHYNNIIHALYSARIPITQRMKCQYETMNGGKYNTIYVDERRRRRRTVETRYVLQQRGRDRSTRQKGK